MGSEGEMTSSLEVWLAVEQRRMNCTALLAEDVMSFYMGEAKRAVVSTLLSRCAVIGCFHLRATWSEYSLHSIH